MTRGVAARGRNFNERLCNTVEMCARLRTRYAAAAAYLEFISRVSVFAVRGSYTRNGRKAVNDSLAGSLRGRYTYYIIASAVVLFIETGEFNISTSIAADFYAPAPIVFVCIMCLVVASLSPIHKYVYTTNALSAPALSLYFRAHTHIYIYIYAGGPPTPISFIF